MTKDDPTQFHSCWRACGMPFMGYSEQGHEHEHAPEQPGKSPGKPALAKAVVAAQRSGRQLLTRVRAWIAPPVAKAARTTIKAPGSRGGRFYYRANGEVVYGTKPPEGFGGVNRFGTAEEFMTATKDWTPRDHHVQMKELHRQANKESPLSPKTRMLESLARMHERSMYRDDPHELALELDTAHHAAGEIHDPLIAELHAAGGPAARTLASDLTLDKTYKAAAHHAETCQECSEPIVDEEGNPGNFSEACPKGLKLLADYAKASGDSVPKWVEETHMGTTAKAQLVLEGPPVAVALEGGRLIVKAGVQNPGSRGGRGHFNDQGEWQYGDKILHAYIPNKGATRIAHPEHHELLSKHGFDARDAWRSSAEENTPGNVPHTIVYGKGNHRIDVHPGGRWKHRSGQFGETQTGREGADHASLGRYLRKEFPKNAD